METYAKIAAWLVKFKDIITTIVSFLPLAYGIIDTYSVWQAGGSTNIGELLMGLVIFVSGWFIGKNKLTHPTVEK